MDKLMTALHKQGIEATEDQAIAAVSALGFDIERITAPQIGEVIKQLSGGLAVSAPSGAATTGNKNRKPKKTDPAPGNGISRLASQKIAEMGAIQSQIVGGIDSEVDFYVDETVDAIKDMPQEFLRRLELKAGAVATESADFHDATNPYLNVLFPASRGL